MLTILSKFRLRSYASSLYIEWNKQAICYKKQTNWLLFLMHIGQFAVLLISYVYYCKFKHKQLIMHVWRWWIERSIFSEIHSNLQHFSLFSVKIRVWVRDGVRVRVRVWVRVSVKFSQIIVNSAVSCREYSRELFHDVLWAPMSTIQSRVSQRVTTHCDSTRVGHPKPHEPTHLSQ